MLGPSPHWDQIQNSKNAHPHAKILCRTPCCFAEPFSLHIVLDLQHFYFPLKNDVSAKWIPDRKKGGCCDLDMLKNKLQIPETHKKKQNRHSHKLSGPISISYCDTICLAASFVVGPPCCASNHQSWRCTVCSSSTIMDKEDVTSRIKHSATEISSWCTACFSSQYKMSVLAWVMNEGIKAESI